MLNHFANTINLMTTYTVVVRTGLARNDTPHPRFSGGGVVCPHRVLQDLGVAADVR